MVRRSEQGVLMDKLKEVTIKAPEYGCTYKKHLGG